MLSNTSYKITANTITTNAANESILLLVVEFQSSVNLSENATSITTVKDPFNSATYTITKIIAARPSGDAFCGFIISAMHACPVCFYTCEVVTENRLLPSICLS